MNAAQLGSAIHDSLRNTRLIVVANREPYIHVRRRQATRGLWNWLRGRTETVGIEWTRPASGLVTALDPVMRACGGTWIAHGSGNADRETADGRGRIKVPPDRPSYTLKRIWLSEEEEQGYYYGCANGALWPLCHIAYARPEFDDRDWQQYVKVNRRFADAVIEEVADDRAVVFVQDYHFALLPRFVKEARPDVTVCQFWHIPWPNREAFRVCPWGEDILHGLLGNDLLGFHVQYHCNNCMNLVTKEFIASRQDEHGVLVLSEFTGAARELEHAVHVNPFAVDSFADALHTALLMPADDQRRRMRALRERVGSHTVFDWAGALLNAACKMEPVR